jgi:hypothetical protein
MLLILVQEGEVITHHTMTPSPCHLKEARTERDSRYYYEEAFDKVGEAFYTQRGSFFDTNEFDFEPELAEIQRPPKLMPTIQMNGKYYYMSECYHSDEAITESLDSWSCPDEIKELPNGIYQVLFEHACYSYTTMDGTEGDSESDFKVYDSIPLWDYLKNKDWMIAEANPVGEELASRYLYIQETKQYRKKR